MCVDPVVIAIQESKDQLTINIWHGIMAARGMFLYGHMLYV